jgi:hypothetical protein
LIFLPGKTPGSTSHWISAVANVSSTSMRAGRIRNWPVLRPGSWASDREAS